MCVCARFSNIRADFKGPSKGPNLSRGCDREGVGYCEGGGCGCHLQATCYAHGGHGEGVSGLGEGKVNALHAPEVRETCPCAERASAHTCAEGCVCMSKGRKSLLCAFGMYVPIYC